MFKECFEAGQRRTTLKGEDHNLVTSWLVTNYNHLVTIVALLGHQMLGDLLIQLNSLTLSGGGGGGELLFSKAKDILRIKRLSQSDENLAMLMFMKGNMQLMEKIENEKEKN